MWVGGEIETKHQTLRDEGREARDTTESPVSSTRLPNSDNVITDQTDRRGGSRHESSNRL